MSQHLAHISCKKSPKLSTRKTEFYDVLEVTNPKGCPSFANVVRQFTSSREHSRSEYEAFLEAFERDYYSEINGGCVFEFYKFPHTLRHARKAFLKLVANGQEKYAKVLLISSFKFMESCCKALNVGYRDNTNDEVRAKACFEELIRFALSHFVFSRVSNITFDSNMMKHLLIRAKDVGGEVEELVYVTVLEQKLLMYSNLQNYSKLSVSRQEWAMLQQVLLFLAEDVSKPRLSQKVKGLIGRILALLEKATFSNDSFAYDSRARLKVVAMGAYQVSVKYILTQLRIWLDGKQPGKKLKHEA